MTNTDKRDHAGRQPSAEHPRSGNDNVKRRSPRQQTDAEAEPQTSPDQASPAGPSPAGSSPAGPSPARPSPGDDRDDDAWEFGPDSEGGALLEAIDDDDLVGESEYSLLSSLHTRRSPLDGDDDEGAGQGLQGAAEPSPGPHEWTSSEVPEARVEELGRRYLETVTEAPAHERREDELNDDEPLDEVLEDLEPAASRSWRPEERPMRETVMQPARPRARVPKPTRGPKPTPSRGARARASKPPAPARTRASKPPAPARARASKPPAPAHGDGTRPGAPRGRGPSRSEEGGRGAKPTSSRGPQGRSAKPIGSGGRGAKPSPSGRRGSRPARGK